jgi:hypothetical protein
MVKFERSTPRMVGIGGTCERRLDLRLAGRSAIEPERDLIDVCGTRDADVCATVVE